MTRRQAVVALSLCRGIGSKSLTRIFVRNELMARSNEDLFKLSQGVLQEEYGLTSAVAQRWVAERKQHQKEAARQCAELDRLGVEIALYSDPHFPSHIEEIDPKLPGILYLYGNQKLLRGDTFAIMASRNSTKDDLNAVEQRTEEGVLAGKILVSGHTKDAYRTSSVVPLRWGAPRILVLDASFYEAHGEHLEEEPFRAARLWRYKFDSTTDLALTWIPPVQTGHRGANATRDRLIAGLAKTIEFIKVAPGGNMETILKSALRTKRTVRVSELDERAAHWESLGAETFPAPVESF